MKNLAIVDLPCYRFKCWPIDQSNVKMLNSVCKCEGKVQ